MREFLAFLPYVFRTARRARTRTILTVLGAALAMGLFAFVRTVDGGVADLERRSSTPVLVVFEESRFCPLTSMLPVRYESAIREVPGVVDVMPTLVFINSCRANLDLVTLHGVSGDALNRVYDLEVLEGDKTSWRQRSDGALVGERLARRRGARVGDRIQLENVDVFVTGIVRSNAAGIDNLAFVNMDQLALARKQLGAATQFMVTIEPGSDPAAVARAIDAKFATDEARTNTQSMQAFVAGAVGEISEVVEFARMLGYIAVLVVALVLANTVYISAQARAREMGVLETVGLTKPRLAGLIAMEGVGLGLVGGLLGTLGVLVFFWVHPVTLGVEGYGVDFTPRLGVAVHGLLASLAIGAAASIGPAVEVVRRPLYNAVRSE